MLFVPGLPTRQDMSPTQDGYRLPRALEKHFVLEKYLSCIACDDNEPTESISRELGLSLSGSGRSTRTGAHRRPDDPHRRRLPDVFRPDQVVEHGPIGEEDGRGRQNRAGPCRWTPSCVVIGLRDRLCRDAGKAQITSAETV